MKCEIKRVVPYLLFFLCLGIYTADMINSLTKFAAAFILMLAACFLCAFLTKRLFTSFFPLMFLAGIFLFKAALTDPFADALVSNAVNNRKEVCVNGVITDFSPRGEDFIYKIKAENINFTDGTKTEEPYGIRLITKQKFSCGDKVSVISRIYAHNGKFNPSDFDNRLYLRIHGYDYSIYIDKPDDGKIIVKGKEKSAVYLVRNKMYALRDRVSAVFDANFTERQAGVLKAVAIGDKSGADYDLKQNFRDAGIYHFLAISGLHLSVIAGFLVWLLKKIDKKGAYIFTMLFLALYWIMTGGSVSATRAVLMIFILLVGKLIYRRYDLINAVSLAALILLLFEPLFLFDSGFLYSFAAVYGIALSVGAAEKAGIENKIFMSAAASFGATLFTRIISLVTYYTINLYDIFINLLLIPFMGLIVVYAMIIGFAGLLFNVSLVSKPLGAAVDLLDFTAEKLSGFASLTVGCPTKTVFALIIISALLLVLFLLEPKAKRLCTALFTLVFIIPLSLAEDPEPTVNFLYVGQGDCCVINKGKTAYIYDCGGNALSEMGEDTGTYRIMPFLNYSGINKVGAVFISHTDTDHIKGLFDLLKGGVDIDKIYLAEFAEENNNFNTLMSLAKEKNVPVERLCAGESLELDKMVFTCLYPYENANDNNDNSMVLKWEYGGKSVLLTGDISKKAEKTLPADEINADILKLSHHGSKTSTSVYLVKNASPTYAVASAGYNNYLGHPSLETVERMRKYGVVLYKTYDGTVSFMYKDGNFTVYRYENLEYNSIVRSLKKDQKLNIEN